MTVRTTKTGRTTKTVRTTKTKTDLVYSESDEPLGEDKLVQVPTL